jgi:hypothetical protein
MIAVPEARTVRVDVEDAASGFRCGDAALDEFFARYACSNDGRGIGRTYVLRRSGGAAGELPRVLGLRRFVSDVGRFGVPGRGARNRGEPRRTLVAWQMGGKNLRLGRAAPRPSHRISLSVASRADL